MPSSDVPTLRALALHLQAAAAAEDWPRLGQLDVLVAQCVQESTEAELSEAWALVAQAHAHALEACKRAREAAEIELRQLQKSQEAQKAYAWQQVLE